MYDSLIEMGMWVQPLRYLEIVYEGLGMDIRSLNIRNMKRTYEVRTPETWNGYTGSDHPEREMDIQGLDYPEHEVGIRGPCTRNVFGSTTQCVPSKNFSSFK